MNSVQKIHLPKTVMLIGMMGAGKTTVGKRLAQYFGAPFVDADAEIERASGFSVKELFRKFGEDEFFKGEERVVERLLNGPTCVLSSGGTSFVSEKVREISKRSAITVWLKADYDVLYLRTKGRKHRPLIPSDNPESALKRMIEEFYPLYANADIVIETMNENPKKTCLRIASAIEEFLV